MEQQPLMQRVFFINRTLRVLHSNLLSSIGLKLPILFWSLLMGNIAIFACHWLYSFLDLNKKLLCYFDNAKLLLRGCWPGHYCGNKISGRFLTVTRVQIVPLLFWGTIFCGVSLFSAKQMMRNALLMSVTDVVVTDNTEVRCKRWWGHNDPRFLPLLSHI